MEEKNELSLTINEDRPCFIFSDGTIKNSQAPHLFNVSGGVLEFAENYMEKLKELYDSVEQMRSHAAEKIVEYNLLDDANSNYYSIWLLVAMTAE